MGYWIIRNGKVEWDARTVDPETHVDTGQTRWWSSWAPSMFGLFNARLPIYQRAAWTKKELAATVGRIRQEIADHDEKWTIDVKTLGPSGMSTCQATLSDAKRHQSLRTYNIIVNRSEPLGYELPGLSADALLDVGRVHEQTHALCDISYTANNKVSRLATWNDEDGEFSESSEATGAHRKRAETLWGTLDSDAYLSSTLKEIMSSRLAYGYGNLVDIDTVVNELCLVAAYADESLLSPTIRSLIDFAELNLGYRAIGRAMQKESPKLRVF